VTPAAAPGGESTSAWIPLDANTDFPQNVWKHERISPKAHRTSALEESKHYLVDTASVVSVTAWDSEAPVEATRFALVTGPGLWKALEAKIASKVEDKNDPTRYWLTLVYVTETDPKLLQPGVIPRVAWMVRAEALGASEVTPPAPAPAAVVDDTPPTPPAAPPSPEQMTIDPDAPPFNLDEIPF